MHIESLTITVTAAVIAVLAGYATTYMSNTADECMKSKPQLPDDCCNHRREYAALHRA
jgi:hypothetical protein